MLYNPIMAAYGVRLLASLGLLPAALLDGASGW